LSQVDLIARCGAKPNETLALTLTLGQQLYFSQHCHQVPTNNTEVKALFNGNVTTKVKVLQWNTSN